MTLARWLGWLIPASDREFILGDLQDVGQSPLVVLIDETFARVGWGGEDPIGQRVQYGGAEQPWRTVVGIVENVHHTGLDEEPAPQIYIPESEGQFADGSMDFAVRTRGNLAALAPAVRAAIKSVDPTQPILNISTMDQVVSATAQQRRFTFVLFQVFAVVALLLAAAGIYGVLAGSAPGKSGSDPRWALRGPACSAWWSVRDSRSRRRGWPRAPWERWRSPGSSRRCSSASTRAIRSPSAVS